MSLDKLTTAEKSPSHPAASTPAKRHRSYAWLLPVGLLIGFIGILLLLFGERLLPATEVAVAPVITLRSAADEKSAAPREAPSGKGEMLFQASGWVEPDPYVTYVPALINGVVDEVHVLEGQSVKKGQLLATLIDDDAHLDLQEAEQNIKSMQSSIQAHCQGIDIAKVELQAAKKRVLSAEAKLAEAADHLNRLRKTVDGAIPKQQIVQANQKLQQLKAAVAETETAIPLFKAKIKQIDQERIAMEAKVDQLKIIRSRAKLALARTRITSPKDGIVLHLHAAPGKKRMLNMDDPKSSVIVELYNPEKLQARIDVPLNEAAALQLEQRVELLSDLLPEKIFTGQVTRITGQADLQRNTLQVKVAITNPDTRLRPDMLVRAKFYSRGGATNSGNQSSSGRLSIYVPESALVSDKQVWVVSPESTATLREIQLSTESRDGHRRVLNGLKSGEKVILPPHSGLSEGAHVTTNPNK